MSPTAFKMTYAPLLNRAALAGREAVASMADDILVITVNDGGATERDLEIIGYTQAQIAKHGEAARRAAQARVVR